MCSGALVGSDSPRDDGNSNSGDRLNRNPQTGFRPKTPVNGQRINFCVANMKRVTRSKSGREIYGPKWLNNINMESENENGDDSLHSVNDSGEIAPVSDGAPPPAATDETVVDNEDQTQTSEGINIRGNLTYRHQSMYRATLVGDCVAIEMLLEGDPKLGSDEINEDGDRALHVAAAMKRQEIVQKLVEKMNPNDLSLLDGHGYTACCYAAITGSVEIADVMIRKNPALATARDRENKTPLHKAALRGNGEMVSYFLKTAKVGDLSTQEWFDLLLITIRCEMYGAALEILERDKQLATLTNDEGTALHLLARQCFFVNSWQMINGVMRQDMQLLAKKLWADIQNLGQASLLELMKINPPILHNAAEVGNVELITMLTHTYPDLVWLTNNEGYTIFHIAVNFRHFHLFSMINEIGARKDLLAASQDENGNNILHLAAELAPPGNRWTFLMAVFQMQREMLWFKKVQAIVPPLCLEMRNQEGHTPRELFSKRHKSLLEESRTWIRNTADSCMLISTLIFSVVFASAFVVPGGYNQDTGIPILYKTNWFTCFIIFEALAMFSSALCIVFFLRIMMLGFEETHFIEILPRWIVRGLDALTLSVLGAISAFMSAYFMIYTEERAVLIVSLVICLYLAIVFAVCHQIFTLRITLPQTVFRNQTLYTLFKI
ncbi:hypothetical protein C2S52_001948 [Perilla frutescens var. hirtella]|nr:hypothetical protein C2S52_001948 [Perilla frutescens var. hirtella]